MREGNNALAELVASADYPIVVLTACAGGRRAGCLVGFSTQVSIDPPRMLVCVSKANYTHRVVAEASHAAIHLLEPHQLSLARLFGEQTGDDVDKFTRCGWRAGPHRVPVLTDSSMWLCGCIVERHDFGDHTGLVLVPESGTGLRPVRALRSHAVADLEPGHPVT